jgi:epoxyqueuosine reductase QueG
MSIGIKDLGIWIEDVVKMFINESPENTMKKGEMEKVWAEPLVGVSSGTDPLYAFYKKDIGEFYRVPLDWFTHAFPSVEVTPKQLNVISWILPQTEKTKAEHRKATQYPTERWARARIRGEEVNNKLRQYVVDVLMTAGYPALAPLLSPLWKGATSEKYSNASNWSERHAAYVAGLGTFGLCDGLITPKGKAMRCGSVIAKIQILPTPRPYTNHNAYCLYYAKGTCGQCIQRCPANAISKNGHNKKRCSLYLRTTRVYVRTQYHFQGYGCGLCQTGVPCESGIPEELVRNRTS